ncbi:hypothetical protein VB834_03300 [Limnoraphis robusta Tam1]|jgi:hypothetical protein|uniref:Uncharacterized protein n=1 Tax=Limnoraphis robusta CCNP1315 TaxID=3110306 RepID=A0ABU5TWJ7_9CYAN|nr:hypothetical protein [Limnoraphis robusta]MEA5497729.1 hypothetical protein [Limnoraphis robusta BA-68 BA1]MEA5519293.1 hypothetical protein [Limnoraphis robusta CCNP1315]MEA5538053.1 hypothetical protein [Limnoraphis robusta Tam1]MEA5549035.1 hypothetical protein [Limnoraphis robusta CCNP1324]
MKTQNLLSQVVDTVNTRSALSATWTTFPKTEVHHSSKLDWKEQDHTCQATYSDEFGTIELHIEKETHNPKNEKHHYRVTYQYRSPEGHLIAQGIWEPKETIAQAKQLAEFQWRQFL